MNDNSGEREFALQVVQRLREAGYQALWAGGCVRDLLLGNDPSDYDVATSATPQQVRQLFGMRRTLPVGASFGVVIVLSPSRLAGQVEVATFRTESTYSDGRHPDSVQFSTAEQDALRRDFTINGMFYDPIEERTIDYVGGQRDLEAGVVRAIGNARERIGEDKLRMLRAVRFAARFHFAIDESTLLAITQHAPELEAVSGERIATEVAKTLATERSAWAVRQWQQTGLLAEFLPAAADNWAQIGNNVLRLLASVEELPWHSTMAVLLWPLVQENLASADTLTSALKKRLKWSNESQREIRFALERQCVLEQADKSAWSSVQPTLIDEHVATAMDLLQARARVGQVAKGTVDWLADQLALPTSELNPAPLLTGDDLIRNGYRPNPQFSHWLQQVRNLQLDARIANSAEALQWVETTASGDPAGE